VSKSNKKQKKKRRGRTGSRVGTGNVLNAKLVRETLGNFLGGVMAAGLAGAAAQYGGGAARGNGRRGLPPPPPPAGETDVAAVLLQALAEHGPKSIPELIELTGVGLSPTLQALRSVQKFRLVEFVEDGGVVQLTATGNQTVTVIRKDEAPAESSRLLEG
jgi:hypothetical protein